MTLPPVSRSFEGAFTLQKPLILVGMMGAGKTRVGQALAKAMDVGFCDLDALICQQSGRTISEIFEREGEAVFRMMETRILGTALVRPVGVISTGGGAFISEKNRAMIADAGCSVYLRLQLDQLWERVKDSQKRPLLQGKDGRKKLTEIYRARAMIYEMADYILDVEALWEIDDTCSALLALLEGEKLVMRDG